MTLLQLQDQQRSGLLGTLRRQLSGAHQHEGNSQHVKHYRNFHSTLFHSPRNKIIFYTFYKMIFCLNIKSKNAFTVYRFIAEMDEPVDKNCQKNIIPSISYIANKTIYGLDRGWNYSTECLN